MKITRQFHQNASRLFCIAAVAFCGANRTLAQDMVIQPGPEGKDTYVDNRYRPDLNPPDLYNQNYGSADSIQIGHDDTRNTNFDDGLIAFDISQLPLAEVSTVKVVLTIKPVPDGAGSPATVYAYRITNAWDESTVTWNSRPSFDPSPVASAFVQNTLGEAVEWDITALYRDWKNGVVPNYGLYFSAGTNNGEGFTFVSSDNTTWPQLRPQLRLTVPPRVTIEVAQVRVCWGSLSNRLYQVQYRSELTTNTWVDLGGPITGTGGTDCITDAVSGPMRFYRAVALP